MRVAAGDFQDVAQSQKIKWWAPLAALVAIYQEVIALKEAVQKLIEKVAKQTEVDQSVIVLLGGLSQQIRDLAAQIADNPAAVAKLNELADTIDANNSALAQAAIDNTPAA